MRGFSETEGDFSCHICKRLGFDGERLILMVGFLGD